MRVIPAVSRPVMVVTHSWHDANVEECSVMVRGRHVFLWRVNVYISNANRHSLLDDALSTLWQARMSRTAMVVDSPPRTGLPDRRWEYDLSELGGELLSPSRRDSIGELDRERLTENGITEPPR